MFRHFVGKIYILEEPPAPSDTQLELTFPDELLADVDEEKYKQQLTDKQLAKLLHYKEEMAQIMGQESFERLRNEGALISSDTELISTIVFAIKNDPKFVRALANLHTPSSDYCVWTLSNKVLKLVPGGWEAGYAKFAEFVRILSAIGGFLFLNYWISYRHMTLQ